MSQAFVEIQIISRKKTYSPVCHECRSRAHYEVKFDNVDHFSIRRYCQECFVKAGYSEP